MIYLIKRSAFICSWQTSSLEQDSLSNAITATVSRRVRALNTDNKLIPGDLNHRKTFCPEFFVRGHAEGGGVTTPRVREQTIVQIALYFMITRVQTALCKAGNYDKTGRTRKNMHDAHFSCTQRGREYKRCVVARKHAALGSSQATLRSNWLSLIVERLMKFGINYEKLILKIAKYYFFTRTSFAPLNYQRKIEIK